MVLLGTVLNTSCYVLLLLLFLFPYFLEKRLAIRTSPFFHLLVNGFCVTSFRTFFEDPLPSLYWWVVLLGGEELKWRQLAHHQLMSQQGPHFSPHSTVKTDEKSTNLRKNGL